VVSRGPARGLVLVMESSNNFLYHVTTYNRLQAIDEIGLVPTESRLMSGKAYEHHARDRIFLTEEEGISFWYDLALQWAHHKSDDLLEDEMIPVVLRVFVPDDVFEQFCVEDPLGTRDARSEAWACKISIPPNAIEFFWDGVWVSVDKWEQVNLGACFDIEGYFLDNCPSFYA